MEKRGGKRSNPGGRPRKTLSELAVERALEACERYAERFGKTTDEILLDAVYGVDWAGEITPAARIKAIQEINRRTAPPLIEGGQADRNAGPGVYLPEERPDPAKVVPFKQVDSG